MLLVLPLFASADSLPAGVRACAAEPDANKRLACFDREVARYRATAPATAIASASATAAAPATAAASATAAAPAPAAKSQDAFGLSLEQVQPKAPKRMTARVVSVQDLPGGMVVHLDNGQVWAEVPEGTVSTRLRPDDTVTIDKGVMGAYWLRGPAAGVIKVKRKQ